MFASSPDEIGGKTVLITGGTAGIGFHTARTLATRGAQVIITGREEAPGQHAAEMIDQCGNQPVTFIKVDHSTVGGSQHLADRIRGSFSGLDVLINNVGGVFNTRRETADGYEATLAMDFVGAFALTTELLPLLRANAPARCINVVSAGFKMCKSDPFEDVQSSREYVAGDAYARAKLLNLMASLALADRVADDGITVNAVHPGMSWTQMTQSMTAQTVPVLRYAWPILRLVQRLGSPDRAGRRVATLASSALVSRYTGRYFERGLTPKRLSARELDVANQHRAWQLAAELVAAAPTGRRLTVPPG